MRQAFAAPLTLERVRHPEAVPRLLYHHQALVLDEWDRESTFYLETKTGTGKTTAAMLPLITRKLSAVAVYPTNELLRDQVSGIKRLAEEEGLRVCVWTPEDEAGYAEANLVLVPVDGDLLAQWRKKRGYPTKGRALQELLGADKPFKIILTNPDVLFLILALKYRAEPLAAALQYHALVIDEFHLYTGVELAHALMMADFGRRLGAFEKILLLSATPDPETRILVERLLKPCRRVTLEDRTTHPVHAPQTAVHRVRLGSVLAGRDVVETALGEIRIRRDEIRAQRHSRAEPGFLPALVVLTSVVDAIRLEDRLVDEGLFTREELAPIRGLSSREVRQLAGKHLAVGTSAVEVGIDFRCNLLVFEASEAASFLQRFGRVGRHEEGTAVMLCPPNVIEGVRRIGEELGEIGRAEFEERVHVWYKERPAYAWFATTYGGLVTTRALVESILIKMQDDYRADAVEVADSAAMLVDHWRSYARALGADEACIGQVQLHFEKMHQRPWLRAYSDLNTFRTSLPSEWVHDFAEHDRRGEAGLGDYQVDISTLLRRAERLRFNETWWNNHVTPSKQGMLTVGGYGRWRRVEVVPTCECLSDGEFGTTDDLDYADLRFVQDGNRHCTPVSHVMSLKPHVFALFPKSLRHELDWRISVFECGDRVIAYDGAALLANEIWRRKRDGAP